MEGKTCRYNDMRTVWYEEDRDKRMRNMNGPEMPVIPESVLFAGQRAR